MIAIVNVNKKWGIGRDGDLLVNIPEDMKFFRTVTAGSTVIMGRKTLESFPGGKPLKGRINIVLTSDPARIKRESIEAADAFYCIPEERQAALKDIGDTALKNLELTHAGAKASEKRTLLIALKNRQEALSLTAYIEGLADSSADEESTGGLKKSVFVIGGASVYELFLSDCGQCLVTKNNSELTADSYFPNLDLSSEWELTERGETLTSENGNEYAFDSYMRKTETEKQH